MSKILLSAPTTDTHRYSKEQIKSMLNTCKAFCAEWESKNPGCEAFASTVTGVQNFLVSVRINHPHQSRFTKTNYWKHDYWTSGHLPDLLDRLRAAVIEQIETELYGDK